MMTELSVLSKLTIKAGKMVGRRHYNILLLSSCTYTILSVQALRTTCCSLTILIFQKITFELNIQDMYFWRFRLVLVLLRVPLGHLFSIRSCWRRLRKSSGTHTNQCSNTSQDLYWTKKTTICGCGVKGFICLSCCHSVLK